MINLRYQNSALLNEVSIWIRVTVTKEPKFATNPNLSSWSKLVTPQESK